MFDTTTALLDRCGLLTWQEDAPVCRELERLREDVKRYRVAAGYGPGKATNRYAQVNGRTDRIRCFLQGHRRGYHFNCEASRYV